MMEGLSKYIHKYIHTCVCVIIMYVCVSVYFMFITYIYIYIYICVCVCVCVCVCEHTFCVNVYSTTFYYYFFLLPDILSQKNIKTIESGRWSACCTKSFFPHCKLTPCAFAIQTSTCQYKSKWWNIDSHLTFTDIKENKFLTKKFF